eukprot:14351567-Ditylum_brightwellii.AAC.1
MVISTKDMWLPGLTNFGQWETSNRFREMKVLLVEQIEMVERQNWESIHMNLVGYAKARGIAISCFPESITWQLVTKLIYQ